MAKQSDDQEAIRECPSQAHASQKKDRKRKRRREKEKFQNLLEGFCDVIKQTFRLCIVPTPLSRTTWRVGPSHRRRFSSCDGKASCRAYASSKVNPRPSSARPPSDTRLSSVDTTRKQKSFSPRASFACDASREPQRVFFHSLWYVLKTSGCDEVCDPTDSTRRPQPVARAGCQAHLLERRTVAAATAS